MIQAFNRSNQLLDNRATVSKKGYGIIDKIPKYIWDFAEWFMGHTKLPKYPLYYMRYVQGEYKWFRAKENGKTKLDLTRLARNLYGTNYWATVGNTFTDYFVIDIDMKKNLGWWVLDNTPAPGLEMVIKYIFTRLPLPTFFLKSTNGAHLYYLLNEPVFYKYASRDIRRQLGELPIGKYEIMPTSSRQIKLPSLDNWLDPVTFKTISYKNRIFNKNEFKVFNLYELDIYKYNFKNEKSIKRKQKTINQLSDNTFRILNNIEKEYKEKPIKDGHNILFLKVSPIFYKAGLSIDESIRLYRNFISDDYRGKLYCSNHHLMMKRIEAKFKASFRKLRKNPVIRCIRNYNLKHHFNESEEISQPKHILNDIPLKELVKIIISRSPISTSADKNLHDFWYKFLSKCRRHLCQIQSSIDLIERETYKNPSYFGNAAAHRVPIPYVMLARWWKKGYKKQLDWAIENNLLYNRTNYYIMPKIPDIKGACRYINLNILTLKAWYDEGIKDGYTLLIDMNLKQKVVSDRLKVNKSVVSRWYKSKYVPRKYISKILEFPETL